MSTQESMKVREVIPHIGPISIASSVKGLQHMMYKMQETTVEYGMKINLKTTKVMKISNRPGDDFAIFLEGEQSTQVTHFNYLGSLITQDGYCKKDIRSRIARAKNVFSNRKELLTKVFSCDLKKRIIKTAIWSILLYGAESCSLKKRRYTEVGELRDVALEKSPEHLLV